MIFQVFEGAGGWFQEHPPPHFENSENHKILVIMGGGGSTWEHPKPPTNIDNYDNPQILNKG